MSITVETLTGSSLDRALPAVARLRLTVFRDWPYLYDGTLSHEQDYIAAFAASDGAVIVAARDGEEIVGVATASPLRAHTEAFVPLFEAKGYDPDTVFYFGESVLLSQYRGHGIGHAFFDAREEAARASTGPKGPFAYTSFCGVIRPDNHPRRPKEYRPLDAFWMKRGYGKVDGLIGSFGWKDIDSDVQTVKPMQFWIKPL